MRRSFDPTYEHYELSDSPIVDARARLHEQFGSDHGIVLRAIVEENFWVGIEDSNTQRDMLWWAMCAVADEYDLPTASVERRWTTATRFSVWMLGALAIVLLPGMIIAPLTSAPSRWILLPAVWLSVLGMLAWTIWNSIALSKELYSKRARHIARRRMREHLTESLRPLSPPLADLREVRKLVGERGWASAGVDVDRVCADISTGRASVRQSSDYRDAMQA
ncbi:MAG: hypothetical protein R3B57_12720 [Phycisphaerales bacterium]